MVEARKVLQAWRFEGDGAQSQANQDRVHEETTSSSVAVFKWVNLD